MEKHIDIIVTFILENFPLDKDYDIPLDDSLMEEGIVDSYGLIELIAFIEKEFSLSIDDTKITKDNFDSVNKIALFISNEIKLN
jgi:acyl carrier protein